MNALVREATEQVLGVGPPVRPGPAPAGPENAMNVLAGEAPEQVLRRAVRETRTSLATVVCSSPPPSTPPHPHRSSRRVSRRHA